MSLLRGRWIAAALLVYALAVLARMPDIAWHGRFWAEEGTVFFARAWQLGPAEALFLPYGGYLNIVANGATVLARWAVPLAQAPFVTVGVALIFQLVPPFVLLTARDRWLQPWPVRVGGLALLLLVPAAEEVWLQSLHCQFELTLACAMLLAFDVPSGRRGAVALAILLLAPLSGPGAIALVPLFLLRAVIDRTPGRVAQLAVLSVGAATQLAFFFTLGADRMGSLDLGALLAVVWIKDLLVPFIGINTAVGSADRIRAAALAGHVPVLAVVAPVLAFAAALAAAALARAWPALWLLTGAAVVAVTAYLGALDGAVALMIPRAGIRYSFVPVALTALSFLVMTTRPGWRWPALAICVWLLAVGLRSYIAPWPPARTGPVWAEQVERWQADPAYAMLLWPPPWTLSLPSR